MIKIVDSSNKKIEVKSYKELFSDKKDLSHVKFINRTLKKLNIGCDINLFGASFKKCNITGVTFHTSLGYSIFQDCLLENVHFSNTKKLKFINCVLKNVRLNQLDVAFLEGSTLINTSFNPVQLLTSIDWGYIKSDSLCTDLMNFDAASHPDPKLFIEWAKGGDCPYKVGISRAITFDENPKLYNPRKKLCTPWNLLMRLFKEKNIIYKD